jgi:hypothetical protein
VLGGDPRSSGQGPGLVGDPVTAILLVVLIGVGTSRRDRGLRSDLGRPADLTQR